VAPYRRAISATAWRCTPDAAAEIHRRGAFLSFAEGGGLGEMRGGGTGVNGGDDVDGRSEAKVQGEGGVHSDGALAMEMDFELTL
jgi:hypothetical protein